MLRQIAGWVAVLLPLLMLGYFETQRFAKIYSVCADYHLTHATFAQESVCTNHSLSLKYQHFALVNCSKALTVRENERADLCAIRNWVDSGLLGTLRDTIETLYAKTTHLVMIVAVLPICGVAVYYIRHSQEAETRRLALNLEHQSIPLRMLMNNANADATLNVQGLKQQPTVLTRAASKRRNTLMTPS